MFEELTWMSKIKKYFPIREIQIVSVFFLVSGCVTTTYYTPPPKSMPQAKLRFLAIDNLHYAVTMYENTSCSKGLYSGFMGSPGYDLSKLPHSIPQSVKNFGSTLGMRAVPLSTPLSFIERSIPADKELVFVINRGYDHHASNGSSYMKSCNMTFSFIPKAEANYEAGFGVANDICNLSLFEIEPEVQGEVARTPVSTFRNLEQQCSIYTNP